MTPMWAAAGNDAATLPRVSVVVPVRNGAGVVRAACRSALAQEGVQVELIVVENGSRDGTVETVETMTDQRLRLIRHDGVGVSSARNRGIRAATGDWVAFLDADDVWAPYKLHRQLKTAPVDMVFSDCRLIFDGEVGPATFQQCNLPPAQLRGAGEELLLALLSKGNFIPLSTAIVARAALGRVGGFREGLHHSEDWELWLRLALAGVAWARTPEASTDYAVSATGASGDLRAMYAGEVLALRGLLPQLDGAGVGVLARKRLRRAAVDSVVHGRSTEAPWAQRACDLLHLLCNRPGGRAVLGQTRYTLMPRTSRRATGSILS